MDQQQVSDVRREIPTYRLSAPRAAAGGGRVVRTSEPKTYFPDGPEGLYGIFGLESELDEDVSDDPVPCWGYVSPIEAGA